MALSYNFTRIEKKKTRVENAKTFLMIPLKEHKAYSPYHDEELTFVEVVFPHPDGPLTSLDPNNPNRCHKEFPAIKGFHGFVPLIRLVKRALAALPKLVLYQDGQQQLYNWKFEYEPTLIRNHTLIFGEPSAKGMRRGRPKPIPDQQKPADTSVLAPPRGYRLIFNNDAGTDDALIKQRHIDAGAFEGFPFMYKLPPYGEENQGGRAEGLYHGTLMKQLDGDHYSAAWSDLADAQCADLDGGIRLVASKYKNILANEEEAEVGTWCFFEPDSITHPLIVANVGADRGRHSAGSNARGTVRQGGGRGRPASTARGSGRTGSGSARGGGGSAGRGQHADDCFRLQFLHPLKNLDTRHFGCLIFTYDVLPHHALL